MASKEDIMAAIEAYHASVRDETTSELKMDDLLEAAIAMAPHARLTELIFHGEKERTTEEVAEEAFHRERLWQHGGELAVLLHVHDQMERVAEDPGAKEIDKYHATRGLRDILKEIDAVKGGLTH